MEKIRVNMTPIEEVKTIHASQNDNATRKWAFDLYDENGKIDSSDIKEQMIFDSKVGGTEQILPENTSDPTTSPIIADIQYPDSLRSEQTFLYRESPTSEDGQAKITKIKGNTLVWNQLIHNGNFANNSYWYKTASGVSFTISNNECNITTSSNDGIKNSFDCIAGHKYLISYQVKAVTNLRNIRLVFGGTGFGYYDYTPTALNTYENVLGVITAILNSTSGIIEIYPTASYSNYNYCIKNVMIVDLTVLNYSAITDAPSFRSYYNLPYYAYTTGKLLPFLGTELKTTGKNLNNSFFKNTSAIYSDGRIDYSNTDTTRCAMYDYVTLPSGSYVISTPNTGLQSDCNIYDLDGTFIKKYNNEWKSFPYTITLEKASKIKVYCRKSDNSVFTASDYSVQIEFGSSATSYEPYTSSTINLPTLDYFPTGMKRTGSVYDEITESKAITRVGSVDLGDLTWTYNSANKTMYSQVLSDASATGFPYVVCSIYEYQPTTGASMTDKSCKIDGGRVYVKDLSYTVASTFKQAMADQNVKLYFELATPTEESITTASLVTSKGEAPLYYDDELTADCNETISSESGMFDAKIKLMDDETIYSQKIQLHVERKPQ